ncbi:sugar ABC transporter permease [Microbacterium sp. H37-C3]|uniref:carbohydrate ABC transporter permease n=1 Tax=uncultured Microbacterium sp. TaxID=191216 RepID=UPI0022AE7535|nr:sugar ABC transporter permease [Microbacterium sp. H37-C3]MCZ4068874.1 sugar ABC transporter permease [Microbacterium sp. H37-C3]
MERSQARAGLGFLAPFLIVFALVFIAPLLYAVYLSLFKTQLIGGTAFVGLDNYARAFADEKLWSGLGRVLLVLLVQVPIMLAVAVFAALAIDSGRLAGARFYRIGIFLPYAVPGVVAVLMWGFIYSERYGLTGNINEVLGAPLLDPLSQAWILPAIGNILTWEFMGYNMLIFYSALRTIPSDLYEAAAIDGAGAMRVAWSIKLPALRGALVIATIFSIIGSFQLFNEPNILQTLVPTLISSFFTPNMYAYNLSFVGQQFNYAATVAIIMGIITAVIAYVVQLRGAKEALRS